jgi:hypothetical protein
MACSPLGRGFVAAGTSSEPIGLATQGAVVGKPEVVQVMGPFTLLDWTAVTGTATLTLLADYFTSATPGMLTTTPGGQFVGVALSALTLLIRPGGLGSGSLIGVQPESSLIFRSVLSSVNTAFQMVEATAYFVYVGRTTVAMTPKFVEFQVVNLAVGVGTHEIGIFSTPSPPNKSPQSLTKIESTNVIDTILVGTGVKRNTGAFSTPVPANTHLWAGYRVSSTGAKPFVVALQQDMAQGHILSTIGSPVLTGAGPFAGALIAVVNGVQAPDLRVTLV